MIFGPLMDVKINNLFVDCPTINLSDVPLMLGNLRPIAAELMLAILGQLVRQNVI